MNSKQFVCVLFVYMLCYFVWNAHLYKHFVSFNTVRCQIDTNIRFRYASSYRNLLYLFCSLRFISIASFFSVFILFVFYISYALPLHELSFEGRMRLSHSLSTKNVIIINNGWNIQLERYYFVAKCGFGVSSSVRLS